MPVTVLEVIQRSSEFLAKKGVDSPRLNVELLLAHLLKLPRMGLYLNFGRVLTPAEMEGLRELVRRRGTREPLQHILGSTSFCGLELAVNRHVLVPRPETELLAESGWAFLSAEYGVPSAESPIVASVPSVPFVSSSARENALSIEGGIAHHPTALDFGTGSGCLAIALAVKCPVARVVALDVSPDALAMARQNAASHQVESRIQFIEGDGFSALAPKSRFNLIISNPPYIPSADIATLDPEVREHDPRLALDGGADGLDFYRRQAREAGDFLLPGGRIMVELGDGQAEAVKNLFEQQKWVVEAVKADYSKCPRVLIAHRAG
jgi:release factor glutamine methyltransferase